MTKSIFIARATSFCNYFVFFGFVRFEQDLLKKYYHNSGKNEHSQKIYFLINLHQVFTLYDPTNQCFSKILFTVFLISSFHKILSTNNTLIHFIDSCHFIVGDVITQELRVTSWKFFMRVASYFLRVESKNYKSPIYFTSCELLFTSYELLSRVENKNYELQVMTLFYLKKQFKEHSENRKSLLPV